jgi:hypothetical protein
LLLLATEALILMGKEERGNFLDDVQRHTNHDQHAGATHEGAATFAGEVELVIEEIRQNRDRGEENRTDESNTYQV